MSRDPQKLNVFRLADDLVIEVYRVTGGLPVEERYGLQAQMRRAAVSVPTNIVEGCARQTPKDYLHFVNLALGSASEVRYLLGLASRLDMCPTNRTAPLQRRYSGLIKGLQGLINALAGKAATPPDLRPDASPRPEV